MKNITINIISIIVVIIIALMVGLHCNKDNNCGIGGIIEKPVEEEPIEEVFIDEDPSWLSLVADKIDTGEGTEITKKEVVNDMTIIEFTYKGKTLNANTDYVGYNSCLSGTWGTSTEEFCKKVHFRQINENARCAREGKDAKDEANSKSTLILQTKDL